MDDVEVFASTSDDVKCDDVNVEIEGDLSQGSSHVRMAVALVEVIGRRMSAMSASGSGRERLAGEHRVDVIAT